MRILGADEYDKNTYNKILKEIIEKSGNISDGIKSFSYKSLF